RCPHCGAVTTPLAKLQITQFQLAMTTSSDPAVDLNLQDVNKPVPSHPRGVTGMRVLGTAGNGRSSMATPSSVRRL
ncbi:hypothetical protein EXIGLDRAFT_737428, partial [Exidia glandulosa HHB12029]